MSTCNFRLLGRNLPPAAMIIVEFNVLSPDISSPLL